MLLLCEIIIDLWLAVTYMWYCFIKALYYNIFSGNSFYTFKSS